MEKRKFLILGHPRSGTGFMSILLQRYGYRVGHEWMMEDGISSWMFVVEDNQIFIDRTLNRKNFDFEYIIMNIRHPLDIVSSTYFTENTVKRSLNHRAKFVDMEGLNDVEQTVKSVLGWYRLIEMQRPHLIIHVDRNPEEKMFYFLKRFENYDRLSEPKPKLKKKINTRKHDKLTFSFLKENCRPELIEEFEDFCKLYGYKLKD